MPPEVKTRSVNLWGGEWKAVGVDKLHVYISPVNANPEAICSHAVAEGLSISPEADTGISQSSLFVSQDFWAALKPRGKHSGLASLQAGQGRDQADGQVDVPAVQLEGAQVVAPEAVLEGFVPPSFFPRSGAGQPAPLTD